MHLYHALFEQSATPLFVMMCDGQACVQGNTAFRRTVGWQAMGSEAVLERFHPTRSLTPWRSGFRMFLRDGEMLWVETHDCPRRQPDGSLLWTGYATDITQRKALEAALRSSEQRFPSWSSRGR